MMKKILLLCLLVFTYQKWDAINLYLDPPPDYSAQHGGKAILYSTAWCGYCEKTRKLLSANNIPYFEYDIEKSPEGRQQYDRLNGDGIPVMLINREVIKGYRPEEILELADESF